MMNDDTVIAGDCSWYSVLDRRSLGCSALSDYPCRANVVPPRPDKLNGSPVPIGNISRRLGRETVATADRTER